VALPAGWYIATRAWFESGSGFWRSLVLPQSAWVFAWPVLSIAVAWWLIDPEPRFSAKGLLSLPVAVIGGMLVGLFLGLGFTCEYMNKCM